PGMPTLARQNHCGPVGELGVELSAGWLGGVENPALGLSPFGICCAQLGRDRLGALFARREHELDGRVGSIEATGRVDPWAQAEGEVPLVKAYRLDSGLQAERPHPRAERPAGNRKPAADERAVLA